MRRLMAERPFQLGLVHFGTIGDVSAARLIIKLGARFAARFFSVAASTRLICSADRKLESLGGLRFHPDRFRRDVPSSWCGANSPNSFSDFRISRRRLRAALSRSPASGFSPFAYPRPSLVRHA